MLDVAKFFDEFGGGYTESIRRSNPCYDEMLSSAFDYLPEDWRPEAVLELGCGTGNLTLLLWARFAGARLTANDISTEALAECERRLSPDGADLIKGDMSALLFAPGSFSLVISSLAIHHLPDPEKRALYANVHSWLQPGGYFIVCDRFKEDGASLRETNRRIWRQKALAQGATHEDLDLWSRHEAEYDHPGLLAEQVVRLKEAGFAVADCVWRRWTWATVFAQKA